MMKVNHTSPAPKTNNTYLSFNTDKVLKNQYTIMQFALIKRSKYLKVFLKLKFIELLKNRFIQKRTATSSKASSKCLQFISY